jgi:Tfp pilus assembly protein PilO
MKRIDFQEILAKIRQYITKITQDRKRLIPVICVILVILFLDFSFGLRAQMRALGAVNPKIKELRKGLRNLDSDLARMKGQKSALGVTQVKRLVSSEEMTWIIEEITRLANQQGIRIFQIKPVRGRQDYSSILIGLDLSAGYHQLVRFLAELENHPVFLEIEKMDIERSDKNPFSHKIGLNLKTYVSD